jgi:hypothetical protein
METVTLEKMKQQGHTSNAIEWAKEQYGEYPQRPPKPILSAKHTVDEAEKYVEDFKKFEVVKQKYETQMAEYRNRTNEINNVIVDFIKDEAGLDAVPKQYQDKLYSKAYEEGHSSGYYEVYLKLNSLIEIFE